MTEQQDGGMTIQIGESRKSFHTPVLSRELSRMPADKLPEAVDNLQGLIADYCGILAEALYFDPKLQEKLFTRLQSARKEIAEAESKDPAELVVTLNKVIFDVHRVHARIAKEQEFINKSVGLRWLSPSLVLVYIVIIFGIIALGWRLNLGEGAMPVIGIPLAVVLWSLIGSVAAILYRFYTYRIRELNQVSREVTWLIARPLTGIIMGMVSYLIIIAGLFVFGVAPEPNSDPPTIRSQLLWAVAFLAGFSDRFFEGFIHMLVSRVSDVAAKSTSSADDE
jgi:hypothetical protein